MTYTPQGGTGPQSGGVGGGKSIPTFRRINDISCYYSYAQATGILTAISLSKNILYAIPFYVGSIGRTADIIAINVTTPGAGNNARIGIYMDDNNMYPKELLLDAGDVDISVGGGGGVLSVNINQILSADTIVWLCILADGTTTVRAFSSTSVIHPLGTSSILGTGWNTQWAHTQTYGKLPATFPSSSPVLDTGNIPGIFLRLLT